MFCSSISSQKARDCSSKLAGGQTSGSISDNVPRGLFLEWPDNSPDLSPIESLWAWMEQQLGDREGSNNTDDLQCRLMAIGDSITLTQLHHLFDGMNDRMKLVVKLQVSHIGK